MSPTTLNPTITIQEEPHPPKGDPDGIRPFRPGRSEHAGGVYNTRSISKASFDRRTRSDAVDVEEGDDNWHTDDRQKQVFRGKTLLWYGLLSSSRLPLVCVDVLTCIAQAGIPVRWSDLWRHWHQVSSSSGLAIVLGEYLTDISALSMCSPPPLPRVTRLTRTWSKFCLWSFGL